MKFAPFVFERVGEGGEGGLEDCFRERKLRDGVESRGMT